MSENQKSYSAPKVRQYSFSSLSFAT